MLLDICVKGRGRDKRKRKRRKGTGRHQSQSKPSSNDGQKEYEGHLKNLERKKGKIVSATFNESDLTLLANQKVSDLDRKKIDIIKTIMLKTPEKLNPIIVNRRTDGGLRVLDGNHRITAARELGIKQIKVKIAKSDLDLIKK